MIRTILSIAISFSFLAACSINYKAKSSGSAPSNPNPTLDDQLAGIWILDKSSGQMGGDGIPPVLKLQINRNGLRQADYCRITADQKQGMSGYDIEADVLKVTYHIFKIDSASKQIRLDQIEEKKFSGKITFLNQNTFVLDNKLKYIRYTPTKAQIESEKGMAYPPYLCDL